jgi:hypothetical protein
MLACRRSNKHNMSGDLGRDVLRREKMRCLLDAYDDERDQRTALNGASAAATTDTAPAGAGPAAAEARIRWGVRTAREVTLEELETAMPDVATLDEILPDAFRQPLRVRLGIFLLGGGTRAHLTEARDLPIPDPDYPIMLHERLHLRTARGDVRIRASPNFHGRPVYSWVEIDAGREGKWYAQVLLMFECVFRNESRGVAVVKYLNALGLEYALEFSAAGRAFHWAIGPFECVDVGNILRRVHVVKSPKRLRNDRCVFVLIDNEHQFGVNE